MILFWILFRHLPFLYDSVCWAGSTSSADMKKINKLIIGPGMPLGPGASSGKQKDVYQAGIHAGERLPPDAQDSGNTGELL